MLLLSILSAAEELPQQFPRWSSRESPTVAMWPRCCERGWWTICGESQVSTSWPSLSEADWLPLGSIRFSIEELPSSRGRIGGGVKEIRTGELRHGNSVRVVPAGVVVWWIWLSSRMKMLRSSLSCSIR